MTNELEVYVPDLCAERWKMNYYYNSHPALNETAQVGALAPFSLSTVRIPSEIEKYKKAATVTRDINNIISNMSNSQFDHFYSKIETLRDELLTPSKDNADAATEEPAEAISGGMTTFGNSGDGNSQQQAGNSQQEAGNSQQEAVNFNNRMDRFETTINATVPRSSTITSQSTASSAKQLYKVVFPPKVTSVGRPKGAGQTAVGLKRQNKKKAKSNIPTKQKRIEKVVASKQNGKPTDGAKKFIDLELHEQGWTIISWLTNKSFDEIKKKKIVMGDIIQDINTFNRLRNDAVNLTCVKKYVDSQCYNYLLNEVERLEDQRWPCTKCHKNLSGYQLMCNGCLDWFHADCLGFSKGKAETVTYVYRISFCCFK